MSCGQGPDSLRWRLLTFVSPSATAPWLISSVHSCSGLARASLPTIAQRHIAASRKEFVAKLSVVIEEADESEFWLDVLETKRHGPANEVKRLRQEARELRAIFGKSRSTAARKLKRRTRPKPE
jgi:hypothetical protein